MFCNNYHINLNQAVLKYEGFLTWQNILFTLKPGDWAFTHDRFSRQNQRLFAVIPALTDVPDRVLADPCPVSDLPL